MQWLSGIWRDMCSGCREHGVTCAAVVHPRQEETWRDIRSSYSALSIFVQCFGVSQHIVLVARYSGYTLQEASNTVNTA